MDKTVHLGGGREYGGEGGGWLKGTPTHTVETAVRYTTR